MPSRTFGPTDSVADTRTQVGSTLQFPPYDSIIHTLHVGKGNVVNAKEAAGHIAVETSKRTYNFAYGNGNGGATNSSTGPAEKIECAIPVPANTEVKVYVLDATAAKDVTVSTEFAKENFCKIGNIMCESPEDFRTMAAGGISGNADTAADTEEDFTVSSKLTRASLTPEKSGKIHQIRYGGGGVTDAKAASAKLEVVVPNVTGPFEYAVGNGPGGATLSMAAHADVIDIPDGIPVTSASAIQVKITSAEIVDTPVISLSYW